MSTVLSLWSTKIEVIDNLLENSPLRNQLIAESYADTSIEGQENFSDAQSQLFDIVQPIVLNYCLQSGIEFDSLEFNNLQKGCLHSYSEAMSNDVLYEPHHHLVENSYINAIYYVNSSYEEGKWCGGELAIYKNLTYADYPDNIVNILPKQDRLVIFPGFLTHRVKPYFGDIPRTALVYSWGMDTPAKSQMRIV